MIEIAAKIGIEPGIEIEQTVAWSGTDSVEPAEGVERIDVAVGSLRRAAAFYRRVFGFRPLVGDGSSRPLVMAAGAAVLRLHERDGTTSPHHARRWGFVVADLDRVRQAVWELGIDVVRDSGEPDHIYRWRNRHSLYIRDPEGNDIELLEFMTDAPYLQQASNDTASRLDPSRDMLRTSFADEIACAANPRC